ncbi:unnamed protein product [Adineta steineri]|uniref:AIG1-type G domain-containing protein n=3 Tax=Adineta steineri TaxID=433720 RepID=A0A819CDI4_9BILA|nr:unnamed protein product [Adineta steineri]CAF3810195.1 unnamed protein product [Adineta steineri]
MAKYISACSYFINDQSESENWMYNDDDDDKMINFNKIMDEVQEWSDRNNKYEIRYTLTHNLLLMGKTRTGKTTIAKVIENPCYIPPDAKLYSETKQVTIHPVATTLNNNNNIIYCFNIIDTPGLFDKVKYENRSLTNNKIKKSIEKCMEEDITNIHLFAFVINLQSNLDRDDIDSMIYVKNNYSFLHKYICLIVTHSEETNQQQRQNKIDEFFQSDQIIKHNLKDFFGERIFFMGSLRSQLILYPNKQSIRQQIKNVHQMREIFIEYIQNLDPNDYFNIHHIKNSNICTIL